jgi:acyl-CoA thioesterase FadM
MRSGKIGGKSVVLECLITKTDKNGERAAAKGTNIIVAFDYETNKSLPIPEDWKKAMG